MRGESVRPSSARAALDGRAFVSGTRMLYVGPLAATTRHAHHATQIVFAPHGLFFEDGDDGGIHVRAAVIPPRVPHGHGACAHAAVLFVDGDDRLSRELSRNAGARCETWKRDALDVSLPRDLTAEQARALIASLLSAVEPRQPPGAQHPAARRMCAYLDGEGRVDLATLSRQAGLSPRQMRHTFVRDVGLPMRAYQRWRRLRRAFAAVEEGASLSAAAAAAGFADGAHLSRVFRQQFGITPTQALGSITIRSLD